jgi:hypothetical protein
LISLLCHSLMKIPRVPASDSTVALVDPQVLKSIVRQELPLLSYPAALPLSTSTLNRVAALIRSHRRTIGSRWRVLDAGTQALLTPAYLRKGECDQLKAEGSQW